MRKEIEALNILTKLGPSYLSPPTPQKTTNVWAEVDGDNVVVKTEASALVFNERQAEEIIHVIHANLQKLKGQKNETSA